MKEVQLKDAKATLSHVVNRAVAGEGAIITRRGRLANSPLDADDLPARRPAASLRKGGF
jgi:antitoxin Phd